MTTKGNIIDNDIRQRAVIYCRVSDTKQTTLGSGLDSQETRCREYARHRDYQVVEVFKDDFTGATSDRPAMKTMLAYLKRQKAAHVVIIDDISRLARNVEAHTQLRRAIKAVGAFLASPSIEFKENSDARFVENVLASSAQHMREKNAEQTLNRMRARMLNGYWVFKPPTGYVYKRGEPGQGMVLVRDEPLASIVREALESYASGRFQTQVEVLRFLEAAPEFPRAGGDYIRAERISQMLTFPLYAGYLESSRWNVGLTKARHEPIISYETFRAIQQRLQGGARVPARKDLHTDFPLRGAVACDDCGSPLTACWSKGRQASYPYYLCFERGCPSKGKSIRKHKLEADFEVLLRDLRPTRELFDLAYAFFRDLWDDRARSSRGRRQAMEAELLKTDQAVAQLLDRVVEADSHALVVAYEKRIKALEGSKAELRERMANLGKPTQSFDATFRTAMRFLANPYDLWVSGRIEDKRAVLKLTFSERPRYSRFSGFRTALTSCIFNTISEIGGSAKALACPGGFEPPA